VLSAVLLAGLLEPPPALASSAPLWERVERGALDKALFASTPAQQTFPDFLEGEWKCETRFSGYSFPSATVSKERLVRDTSVPGFLKLSIASLADVGAGAEHTLRFLRRADGAVVADTAANLASAVDGFLRAPAVQAVDVSEGTNRVTVTLKPRATNNAERLELYVNARESGLRPSDGAFLALEQTRQVALGYSTQYGAPRVAVTDYAQAWTFAQAADGSVSASVLTAGFVQPNEALAYTSAGAPGGSLQPPRLEGLLGASTQPVVLYSHAVAMTRRLS